jgi:hypothetical protein
VKGDLKRKGVGHLRCRLETALAVSLACIALTCTVWLHDWPLTAKLTASTMLFCYKKTHTPSTLQQPS